MAKYTIEEINKIGLDRFVSKYKLKMRRYGHKFILKYDQLESPKSAKPVKECRGLILDDELNIVSYPFDRFDNYNENNTKNFDWCSVEYYEKRDGTCIQYYYDNILKKWCVGTLGTAEANEMLSSYNKYTKERITYDYSLVDLFFMVCKSKNINLDKCIIGNTYIFELTCKENQCVNIYDNSIVLLGVRDLSTLSEYSNVILDELSVQMNINRVKKYHFSTIDDAIGSLSNVRLGDTNFEGYVAVDKNHNRLKIKSNMFIVYHQFNGDKLLSNWRLLDIVLNNETDEVLSVFPTLEDTFNKIKRKLEDEIYILSESFDSIKNKNITVKSEFFIMIQHTLGFDKNKKFLFTIFTPLLDNPNITFRESLLLLNKQKMYKYLNLK